MVRWHIERITGRCALVPSPTTEEPRDRFYRGLSEWGGMYFRSNTEVEIARELTEAGGSCSGRI